MTAYLVVIEDTHADPEFRFKWQKGEALTEAANCVAETAMCYKLSPEEIEYQTCGGKYGFWFSAQSPCGSFHISVREIPVPDLSS